MSDWSTSLAGCFSEVADDLRELATDFGARSHRVFLVHRRVSDDGLVRKLELTPTPRVSTEGARYGYAPRGLVREGEIYVSEISLRYTSTQLRGQDLCEIGAHFSWELRPVEDGPTIYGTVRQDPVRDHERAEYRVALSVQAKAGAEVQGGQYA